MNPHVCKWTWTSLAAWSIFKRRVAAAAAALLDRGWLAGGCSVIDVFSVIVPTSAKCASFEFRHRAVEVHICRATARGSLSYVRGLQQ